MANFESGVKSYIVGECKVKVNFPVDWHDNFSVNCYQCKFFSRSSGICQLTKEISEYPQKFIGSCCPLEFSGEIEKSKKE